MTRFTISFTPWRVTWWRIVPIAPRLDAAVEDTVGPPEAVAFPIWVLPMRTYEAVVIGYAVCEIPLGINLISPCDHTRNASAMTQISSMCCRAVLRSLKYGDNRMPFVR